MIKVPSEGSENPIEKVIFYQKPKGKNLPPAVLEPKEVRDMVSLCDILYLLVIARRSENCMPLAHSKL